MMDELWWWEVKWGGVGMWFGGRVMRGEERNGKLGIGIRIGEGRGNNKVGTSTTTVVDVPWDDSEKRTS
jgi:hypothetical protein